MSLNEEGLDVREKDSFDEDEEEEEDGQSLDHEEHKDLMTEFHKRQKNVGSYYINYNKKISLEALTEEEELLLLHSSKKLSVIPLGPLNSNNPHASNGAGGANVGVSNFAQ